MTPREQAAFAAGYESPVFIEARQRVVEELLDGFSARSLDDGGAAYRGYSA